jgi:hypothetical protein
LYTIVYKEIKIANNTIGVSFATIVIVDRRGRFKVNWVFFVAQMLGMGIRGHKGKGGHVDRKGKKTLTTIMSIGKMFAPFLINLNSPITSEREVTTKVYLDEENNPHIPKIVNLVWLFDVKEKKITTIQIDVIELKLEKEFMSTTIKKEAKNLEYATQMHKALL